MYIDGDKVHKVHMVSVKVDDPPLFQLAGLIIQLTGNLSCSSNCSIKACEVISIQKDSYLLQLILSTQGTSTKKDRTYSVTLIETKTPPMKQVYPV